MSKIDPTNLNHFVPNNMAKIAGNAMKSLKLNMKPLNLNNKSIEINGGKITIASSDTLSAIAIKINAISNKIGIKAEIVRNKNDYRLLLKTTSPQVTINDYNSIFSDYFKKQLLGTKKTCLIQVMNTHGKKVQLNYHTSSAKSNIQPSKTVINAEFLKSVSEVVLKNNQEVVVDEEDSNVYSDCKSDEEDNGYTGLEKEDTFAKNIFAIYGFFN